jgi:hypothetical protein
MCGATRDVCFGPIADIDYTPVVIKILFAHPKISVASTINIDAYSDALVVLGTARAP